jgi:hypothetical protein
MQNVPKIVESRLQRQMPVNFESHPDADLLTAFAEQALAGGERDRIVEHLARCGDCREVVSIAVPPQLEPQPFADSTSNWFRWPVLRWTAVAAGVALILALGIMQYRGQHSKQLASNVFFEKQAIATPARTPQASSPQPMPAAGMKAAGMKKDRSATSHSEALAESQPGPIDTDVFRSRTNSAGAIGAPMAGAGISSGADRERNGIPGPAWAAAKQNPFLGPDQRPAAVPSPSHVGEVQAEGAQVTTPTAAPDRMQEQLVQNEPAAQSAASASPGEFVAKAKPASVQAAASTLAPAPSLHAEPILMKSLAVARWTISPAGALQRSLDGVTFRSLSVSSSASEVWAGGSGAALYHTVDGGKLWTRVVPAASGISVSGDIASIQFSDPRHGTVTTSNAEVWATADDGQTWHKQQKLLAWGREPRPSRQGRGPAVFTAGRRDSDESIALAVPGGVASGHRFRRAVGRKQQNRLQPCASMCQCNSSSEPGKGYYQSDVYTVSTVL